MKMVVFGAGGFIGGWLCEELIGREDVELVPCVRRWSSAVRLARRGLNVVQVDLENAAETAAVIAGADVIVNLTMPLPEREADLAFSLYSACSNAGIKKFIQFSSIAVYGDQSGNLDEDAPAAPSSNYGRGKTEMEHRLLIAAERSGPQLFILRPTIVYGPFSDNWTVRYAYLIAKGRCQSLGWAGRGLCNLVHGQDVARAALLAAQAHAELKSYVLNINGPEVVKWNEYVELFADALGVVRRRSNPISFGVSATFAHLAVRKISGWTKCLGLYRSLHSAPALVGKVRSVVNLYPMPEELHLWRQKVRYSWERAGRIIGFYPSMALDEGLRQAAEWCRIHGISS